MIGDERINTYIQSLDTGNAAFLDELERYAIDTYVPIIRPAMQNLLKLLLKMNKPKKILEVGTAIGFSAILMAENTDSSCTVTTIEKYEKRIPIAKKNFKESGYGDRIELIEDDAVNALAKLVKEREGFDFIFMDAAKGQYMNFYDDIMALLNKGGILVSDNVLQDGDIVQSRFAVTRRNRTIHFRMRQYLHTLTHDERLQTSVLPIGDGVTVSVRL